MISNSFMLTISHSDSRSRLICLGIFYYSFTALEVYILTNIYCWCTNQYSIQMVQSYSVCVSGCRFDRDRFELPWIERVTNPIWPKPIRSTEADSTEVTSCTAPRSWPRSRAWCPATECLHPNVRVWIRKITQRHFKNIMKKEHSQ